MATGTSLTPQMSGNQHIIGPDDSILVTGASGFIGARVVGALLQLGYRHVRCLVRTSSNLSRLQEVIAGHDARSETEIVAGNLLSKEDCCAMVGDVAVIYHLAAGTGTKSFSEAFLNSVVTTRNLLDAAISNGLLRRFVSLSSFAVYTNRGQSRNGWLTEDCPMEERPHTRGEAYCYAKVKQDELIFEYAKKHRLPFVLLRPGVVYGPDKSSITGRVGVDTFGLFLHLGGSNRIPFTYVENCALAVALAGLKQGVDGQVFNVVDDDLPTSRQFLRLYKKQVRRFRSIYVPHWASYLLCYLWERYSNWSKGQLPAVFSRREWTAYWKSTRYSNEKLKGRLGWSPTVSTRIGLQRYFEGCRAKRANA